MFLKITTIIFILYSTACLVAQHSNINNQNIDVYTIGSQFYTWVDSSRIDPNYGGFRQVNVQIWYPIDSILQNSKYESANYYYGIENAWQQLSSWSKSDFERVSVVQTKSLVNAPIKQSDAYYPLIIYSPGLGGHFSQFSFYAEELAQRGYVVIGINHLYESQFIIDNDHKFISANYSFHDSLKTLSIPDEISADDYRAAKGPRQKILAEDLIFSLNELKKMNPVRLNNMVDFSQIGAFGHSIGGAAVIYASILDKRFKAILNIDGTPPSVALDKGIEVPFLFIEDLTDYRNHSGYKLQFDRRSNFCFKNKADSYRILFAETNHNSFNDLIYRTSNDNEEIQKSSKLLNKTLDYMSLFFGRYLKSEEFEIKKIQTDSIEVFTFIK